jgi:hypothetical protein
LPVSDLSLLIAAVALMLHSVVWLVLVLRARKVDLPAIARALGSVRAFTVSFGRRTNEEGSVNSE